MPSLNSSEKTPGFLRRLFSLLLPLAVVGLSLAFTVFLIANKPDLQQSSPKIQRVKVEVAPIVRSGRRVEIYSQGTALPAVETVLTAEVPGRVIEIAKQFVVGGFFRKGDLLLRIDARDFEARLIQAESALASAESQLAVERGRSESAYRDWLDLNGDDRESQATALALRKPQLTEAEARVLSAQAQRAEAQLALERTTIRAPYNGLLRERNVNIGQYVAIGSRLGKIYATDSAEVHLALPENKLAYIRLPQPDASSRVPVRLRMELNSRVYEWPAHLVRTEGVFDERNRTLSVIAEISDPYGLHSQKKDYEPLRFGAFVRAVIQGRYFPDVVTVPNNLLRTGRKIWVVDKNDLLQNRTVQTLRTDSENLYVTRGFLPGDQICLTLVGNILPGTPVDIIDGLEQNADSSLPATDQSPVSALRNRHKQGSAVEGASTAKKVLPNDEAS